MDLFEIRLIRVFVESTGFRNILRRIVSTNLEAADRRFQLQVHRMIETTPLHLSIQLIGITKNQGNRGIPQSGLSLS